MGLAGLADDPKVCLLSRSWSWTSGLTNTNLASIVPRFSRPSCWRTSRRARQAPLTCGSVSPIFFFVFCYSYVPLPFEVISMLTARDS